MSRDAWGIVGHEWAVAALRQAVTAERVPHALLFTGPAGVGKRTIARTLMCALECTSADVAGRPCGVCRPCIQIEAGNYPDVRVIVPERASGGQKQDRRDISIDQIRALQHQVSLKPYEGRWVIGLIADAQEMSDAAANCLLKTLEEPQVHAVLILTAPDVAQLLPTIVSRCQVFSLHPLSLDRAEQALAGQFGLAPDQAAVLAHLSGGRLGWALRAAHDEGALAVHKQRLDDLLRLMDSRRGQRMGQAQTMSEDFAKGQDGRDSVYETIDLWATWWRDLLLIQEGCPDQITNADRVDELRNAAAGYHPAQVGRFLADIIRTREYLSRNVNARLALEVLLLGLPQKS
jgi:DNA polymerase III subunit delta'